LDPQVHTVPSDLSAIACSRPPPTSTTPEMFTGPAVNRSVVFPSPSSPKLLLPQIVGVPGIVACAGAPIVSSASPDAAATVSARMCKRIRPPGGVLTRAAIIADGARHEARSIDPIAARDALLDSVRAHLLADVEVGVFLSAGVDSGALLGLMRDAGHERTRAVTLAFDEFNGTHEDEAPLAAKIAAHYGANHVLRRVSEQEFRDDLPRILEAMDQPSIDGVNTWFVAKAAREAGLKVALSGLGGDELLGLARGFLRAGTPSLVVSLWMVNDRSTAQLMCRFYEGLRDGLTKAVALRQAILEVKSAFPHPYYWAPFILLGKS